MSRNDKKTGPSVTELRLRAELDRTRRDLSKLRKANAAAAAAPAEPTPADETAAAEVLAASDLVAGVAETPVVASDPAPSDAEDRRASAAPPATGAAEGREALERRLAELEKTKERLSKLYFTQLDENRRRAQRLHDILRVVSEINADRDLDTLMERIASTIQECLGFRIVLVRLREPGGSGLAAVAFAGLPPTARAALEAEDISLEEFQSWLRDDFRVSHSYFIGHKQSFSRMLPAGFVPDLGRREDWEWHPEDVLLVPLVDGQGEPLGYISVDDPVDRLVPSQETIELLEVFGSHAVVAIENARLYRQLEQRSRELEEADRRMKEMDVLKQQFVSTISHELRTPLAAIRAYSDTLLATGVDGFTTDRVQKFVTVVDDESQRLSRLIESVLDLGRFDSGNRRARRQRVELVEIAREAAEMLRRAAEAGRVELKVTSELADTSLDADRDQLRQLVLHLGSNAIKFTPDGGHVTLRVGGDEANVTLEVEDTGIGIPEDALEKIFDRFYQVDSTTSRRYGGTGLGLAISKSIVEWHGGEVRARSRQGSGSCFTVLLPRRPAPRVVLRPSLDGCEATRDVLRLGVEMVSEVLDARVVSLMSVEPDGSLVIQAAIGLEASVLSEARVRPGSGVAGTVAARRRPVCVAEPGSGELEGSGRDRYRTGTFLSVPLEVADGLLGVLNVTDPISRQAFQIEDCHLLLELAEAISHAWSGALATEARQAGVAGTTDALRTVLDHVRRSRRRAPERVRLAQVVAQELGLAASEAALVAFTATLHDVGMTMMEPALIEGSEPLTPEQRERMQQHVALGDEVLGRLENMGTEMFGRLETMSAVREIVFSHHEWWDGTGYPRALAGTSIPTGARVLAAVDAFESMTVGRPHRPAKSREESLAEIRKLSGTQFDPDVVDALERALSRQPDVVPTPAVDAATSETRR